MVEKQIQVYFQLWEQAGKAICNCLGHALSVILGGPVSSKFIAA